MHLEICPDCAQHVSKSALSCPHCGLPEPSKRAEEIRIATTNVEKHRPAADMGDPDAQNKLGNALYELGRFEESLLWYHKAAAQNWPNSLCNIGSRYAFGEGVAWNPSEAAKWWKKASNLDFSPACLQLGMLYFEGNGVELDQKAALEYFIKGANLDNGECAFNVGLILGGVDENSKLKTDYSRAVDYLRLAAKLGCESPDVLEILAFVESKLRVEKLENQLHALYTDNQNHQQQAILNPLLPQDFGERSSNPTDQNKKNVLSESRNWGDSNSVREKPCPTCGKIGSTYVEPWDSKQGKNDDDMTGGCLIILGLFLSPLIIGIPLLLYGLYLSSRSPRKMVVCSKCSTKFEIKI